MHLGAEEALFGGRGHGAPLLRCAVAAAALLAGAATATPAALLPLAALSPLLLLRDGALARRRALLGAAAAYGAVAGGLAALAGLPRPAALALGLRIAAGIGVVLWLGATTSWPALKAALRRRRVPAPLLDWIDAGVLHGLILLHSLQRRREAALLRLGFAAGARIEVHGRVLAAGLERAFARSLAVEELRLLRAAAARGGGAEGEAEALALRGVSAGYDDDADRLRDVTLSVRPGEWLAILGPSGSGKSTLLRLCAGLLGARAGELRRLGRAVAGAAAGARVDGRVAMLCQDPDDQLLGATPLEDVLWGLRQRGLDEDQACERAERALAELEVLPLAARPMHELSLGERRRVACAGALAAAPELLLCDEATSGLDPVAARRLVAALERLGAPRPPAVLWVSHDLHALPARARRIVLLREGAVCFDGDREEGLSPRWLRAAGLLEAEPGPESRAEPEDPPGAPGRALAR